MMRIFLDSDVIIDLLTQREPYCHSSSILFEYIAGKKLKGFTSPLIFSNINYILRKLLSASQVSNHLIKLNGLLKILSINQEIVSSALSSEFNDFEDALQYFTALEGKVNCIITRNKKAYKKALLPIYSAAELVGQLTVN